MTAPRGPERPDPRMSEPVLGGADAVQKTSYAANVHGTEPRGDAREPDVTAQVRSGGSGALGLVVALIVAAAFAVYAFGLFS